MRFRPERFLYSSSKKSEADPTNLVFGFGRRICPGRILAEQSLYISIAQILSLLTISKKEDDTETKEPRYSASAISFPEPFECRIQPRSLHAEALLRSSKSI